MGLEVVLYSKYLNLDFMDSMAVTVPKTVTEAKMINFLFRLAIVDNAPMSAFIARLIVSDIFLCVRHVSNWFKHNNKLIAIIKSHVNRT